MSDHTDVHDCVAAEQLTQVHTTSLPGGYRGEDQKCEVCGREIRFKIIDDPESANHDTLEEYYEL